jgi:hypothetical protein
MTGAEAPAAHNLGQAFRRLSKASTYRDEPGTLMGSGGYRDAASNL